MKLNTSKEVWIARLIGWLVTGFIAAGVIFTSTFMLGPSLFAIPGLSDKIAIAMHCPGAESTSMDEGASTQTTTSPTDTYGHIVEVTCYFADGSTKTIRNEEFALGSIGGMFGVGAVIGVCVSIPLLLLPLILIRKKKD